jgi:hypothetical protein
MLEHLKAAEGQVEADLWAKMEGYWIFAIQQYLEAEPVEKSDELTWFCSWTAYAPVSLEQLESRLNVSIDHVSRGFGIEQLIDALAERADAEPAVVARLLSRLVGRRMQDLEIYWYGRSLQQVIEGIWKAGDGDVKAIVRRVVDELLRSGMGDFTDSISRNS